MARTNYAVCSRCQKRVPAGHAVRDGRVYLVKSCPECGPNEALLSTDAETWQRKRDICQYDGTEPLTCTLRCETCKRNHHPRMVFLDVTNRCNMNCPICINNTPSMGFTFNPPIEYFEKVLDALAAMEPRPLIQLFGGEPTVRDDLFEIIDMARERGLDVRVVTNGLKLADEEYCRRICERKVHVLIGFDGRDPHIYERLRKNPGAYEKKIRALENLARYSTHKNTIMCCVARGVNDEHMRDLIDYCHENRDHLKCLHMIPLTETWQEGQLDADLHATTTEDVEQIIDEAFPEGRVEFISAGLSGYLRKPTELFGAAPLKFGGVHPNCESATYLLSDGSQYWPMSRYLKRPLDDVAAEAVERIKAMQGKLDRLDPAKRLDRWRGRWMVLRAFAGLAARSLDTRRVLKGNRLFALARILGGMVAGKRLKHLLRRHTNIHSAMLMVVLPFEEFDSIEAARLENCPSAFVYEDPDSGEVKTLPVCIWNLYKNGIQRKIAEKYATAAVG